MNNKVIEVGGARVELYPRTIFTRKMWLGMLKTMGSFIVPLSEALGYPEKIVDDVATDFAYLSARVKSAQGVPFEFLRYEDSAEVCEQKFSVYFEVGVECRDLIDEITKTINQMDMVTTPGGLAPSAPKVSTPSGGSGKSKPSKS